jgi:hypothetical protein
MRDLDLLNDYRPLSQAAGPSGGRPDRFTDNAFPIEP